MAEKEILIEETSDKIEDNSVVKEVNENTSVYIPMVVDGSLIPYHLYTEEVDEDCEEIPLWNFYKIYLNNEIIEPWIYTHLLYTLRNAKCYDIIELYINSPGGCYDTALSIINAMRSSRASIIAYLDGIVASSAALIACASDLMFFYPTSQLIFHNLQTSYEQISTNKIVMQMNALSKLYRSNLKEYCRLILNDKEINKIIDEGKEYIFSGDEIANRYYTNFIEKIDGFETKCLCDTDKIYVRSYWNALKKGEDPDKAEENLREPGIITYATWLKNFKK